MPENPRATVVLAAAQITDDGLQWIEVLPTADKARNGPWYFTITADDLSAFADSIAAQPGAIPVDYDHAEQGTRAAGWFTGKTQVVSDGGTNPAGDTQDRTSLWAEVKWTPQGADDVKNGVFKRISPEWSQPDKDKKTGLLTGAKDFIAATLTNRPFFRELSAVAAAGDVVWDDSTGYMNRLAEISEALNPPGTWAFCVLDVGEGRALVQENGDDAWVVPFTLDADGEAVLAPMSEWQPAEQQWVAAASAAREKVNAGQPGPKKENDMPAELKAVAVELGLADDADEATITAAVKALKDKTPADDAIVVKAGELAELKAQAAKGADAEQRIQAIETERNTEKIDTLLADAVRDRKIVPAAKDALRTQALEHGIAGVKAFLDATPKGTFQARGSGGSGPAGSGDADVEKASARFESTKADGVDEDSVRVTIRAEEILAEQNITDPTQAQYLTAAKKAADELHIVH